MKASSLYIALGAAHLVTCTPVPIAPREQPDDVSDISSREFKHKNSTNDILSSPDSIPPLSKHQVPTVGSARPSRGQIIHDPVPGQIDDIDDIDDIDAVELDNEFEPTGPLYQPEPETTERNDKLVVYLAFAFLLMVVVMETGKTIFRRQGALRLEDNPVEPSTSVRESLPQSEATEDEKQRLPA
ncbi:hypothetical protein MMYC01_207658 [Madurella mycetomatis]|uniref:Uncharacterized protein n=1 Tax=Madurella mycetomatis TaxID=100816 RepID=A0A175VVQ2_9PEZI|nr:hypothetical protein MMYC01_207658 [Madurella mycetomatis]